MSDEKDLFYSFKLEEGSLFQAFAGQQIYNCEACTLARQSRYKNLRGNQLIMKRGLASC